MIKLKGAHFLTVFLMCLVFWFIPVILFAQEIKPGIVITEKNYERYLPALKEVMDPGSYLVVVPYLRKGLITMPIIETEEYPQSWPFHKYTMKYEGTCKVGPRNDLIGWKAGMPFPHAKTGAEVAWNLDRRQGVIDCAYFYSDFNLVNINLVRERKMKWDYWNLYYNGRVQVPPIHEFPGNNGLIRMKESFIILEPFDLRGFSCVRIRYEDIDKPDDFFAYIPAIRRVRRLTGSDVTDPMLGSDTIYDDFEGFRQKITPKMTFELKERDLLCPRRVNIKDRPKLVKNGGIFQTEWEMRPVWELIIHINGACSIIQILTVKFDHST